MDRTERRIRQLYNYIWSQLSSSYNWLKNRQNATKAIEELNSSIQVDLVAIYRTLYPEQQNSDSSQELMEHLPR